MTSLPFSNPSGVSRRNLAAARSPRRLRTTLSLLIGGVALAAAAQAPDPQAMLSAGQTAQALQWLDEQSSLSPWDSRLVAQRAMLLSLLHRDQQALRLLDDMASRNPAEPATYNLMALIHIGSGDYESARSAAQRALRANVGYVPALKTLAEIEMRLARQYYDHAARVDRGADPTLAKRAAALTEVIGKPASAFAQPGALLTLAPAVPSGARRLTQSPSALPNDDGLSITLSQAPEQPGSSSAGRTTKAQPMIALAAVPAAPAGVLINPPGGVAPVSAAGSAHPHEGGPTTTFASLAGGTGPAGFFGNSRLTAVVPAPIGAPPMPTVRITPPPVAVAAVAALPAAPVTVAPALAPAALPQPQSPPPQQPAGSTPAQQAEVDTALRRWTAAWSRRDVAAYMAAYDDGFSGRFNSANGGRAAWERERAERIGGRSAITVELSEVAIRVDGDHAETRFRQRYWSGPLTSVDIKTLHWQRGPAGNWVITREIVGG